MKDACAPFTGLSAPGRDQTGRSGHQPAVREYLGAVCGLALRILGFCLGLP
jgi:hypothetical protein